MRKEKSETHPCKEHAEEVSCEGRMKKERSELTTAKSTPREVT